METPTDVEWTTTRERGVTLVSAVLRSERPRRVRVRPTVAGPVWPPRSDGVPVDGWNDGTFEGVVDGRCALGFATPANDTGEDGTPPERPVDVTWLGPANRTPTFDRHPDVPSVEATPSGVVRALGDPLPPRDAVPSVRTDEDREPSGHGDPPDGRGVPGDSFDLAAVERRVELGERLAGAVSLGEATDAVRRAGGLAGVRALGDSLAEDAARLERAGEDELRERAVRVSVPVETLERIA